jgi:Type IV secretion-system coupling protein DNA-binding domain
MGSSGCAEVSDAGARRRIAERDRQRRRIRREPNSPIDVKTVEFLKIFDFSLLSDTMAQTVAQTLARMTGAPLSETLSDALAQHLAVTDESGQPLELGEFRLCESPAFGRKVADTFACANGLPGWEEFRRLLTARDMPKPSKPSPEYIEAEARAIERDPAKLPYAIALLAHKLGEIYNANLSDYEAKRKKRDTMEQNYQNSDLGYLHFLCAAYPQARSFFFDRFWTLPISEEDRKRHTYITGGAGSGKSEAIKAVMFHYIARNTAPALVLIDPHGDVAEEVAHWPELADGKRLVYIDPALIPDRTPVFNPLDIPESERNPNDISIVVKQLIEVFPELVEGIDFTPQMRTLIGACLTVLLYKPGSSIADLMDFLDETKNAPWLAFADKVLVGSLFQEFFRREFNDKNMDITKRGIRMRLYDVLQNNPAFSGMIKGRSTFNLEELLNRRAVVIFRLSRGDIGEFTSDMIGKFIMARLKAFAFKQGRIPVNERKSVHIFVDECQNYVSESINVILKEARKYGVHLTLAQQILGDEMSPGLLKAVLGNTAVKITGKNALHTLKKIADETGADLDELQSLSTGYFHIKAGNRESIVQRMPSHRVKDKGAVAPEVWTRVRDDQVARFYRSPELVPFGEFKPLRQPLPID